MIQLDPALRHKPWDQDDHDCFKDNKQAIARVNESFVSHSVSTYVCNIHVCVICIIHGEHSHCVT